MKKILKITVFGLLFTINQSYSMGSASRLVRPMAIAGAAVACNYGFVQPKCEYHNATDVIKRCKPMFLSSLRYESVCGKELDLFDVDELDEHRNTALHYAATLPAVPLEAITALIKRGADKDNACNHAKESPLHMAASWGYTDRVESLLKVGANASSTNAKGWTPLHEAAYWGKVPVAKLLLDYGARIDLRTKQEGFTPLDLAIRMRKGAIVLEENETLEQLIANKRAVTMMLKQKQAEEDIFKATGPRL